MIGKANLWLNSVIWQRKNLEQIFIPEVSSYFCVTKTDQLTGFCTHEMRNELLTEQEERETGERSKKCDSL